MQDEVWHEYKSLPLEAQRQAAEFIAFLRQRHGRFSSERKEQPEWETDPFIGMWRDREEMQDSSDWVRRTREREWGGPLG